MLRTTRHYRTTERLTQKRNVSNASRRSGAIPLRGQVWRRKHEDQQYRGHRVCCKYQCDDLRTKQISNKTGQYETFCAYVNSLYLILPICSSILRLISVKIQGFKNTWHGSLNTYNCGW